MTTISGISNQVAFGKKNKKKFSTQDINNIANKKFTKDEVKLKGIQTAKDGRIFYKIGDYLVTEDGIAVDEQKETNGFELVA